MEPTKEKFTDKLREIDPKKLILPVVFLIVFIGTVIGIINYQQKVRSQKNPTIEITKPGEGTILEDAQIVFEGKTTPDANVKVDGKEVTADSKGQFAAEVPLSEGENNISIAVTTKEGKEATATRKIVRASKQPEPVVQQTQAAQPQAEVLPATESDLSSAGPENFWIPEASVLSAIGAAWAMSRKKLSKAFKK